MKNICAAMTALLFWISQPAQAQVENLFVPVTSPNFSQIRNSVEVKNMPRVRSQDSFGICYGFAGATVAQHYYCSLLRIKDCSQVPKHLEVSPVHAATFAHRNSKSSDWWKPGSHKNLHLLNGGHQNKVLMGLSLQKKVASEACFPFDIIANKYGKDISKVNELVSSLESQFRDRKSGKKVDLECLKDQVNDAFSAKNDLKDISAALEKDTFEEFIYRLTLNDVDSAKCKDIIDFSRNPPVFDIYPEESSAPLPQALDKIKEVLSKGSPISLFVDCQVPNGPPCEDHAVVITGYRQQCSASGKCRDVLKIHNSWGEDWQKANNDGWVDAEILFGGKPVERYAMSWLKPSKPLK